MAVTARLLAVPLYVAIFALAIACGGGGNGEPGETERPKTPEETADRFLSLWTEDKLREMYSLLSLEAQAAISRDKFIERYEAIKEVATITEVGYKLGTEPSRAAEGEKRDIPYTVTFQTEFFGEIREENEIPLVKDEITIPAEVEGEEPLVREEWRVNWSPSLYFARLDDRSLVHFFPQVPRRGGIYDRNGKEFAVDAVVSVVGVVPDLITDKEGVITRLAGALGVSEADVRAKVESNVPSYYFIPVRTLPYGTPPEELTKYHEMVSLGVVVREDTQRVYPNGSSAAHVLGYMREVTEEDLEDLAAKGYGPGDRIGAAGIEGEKEEILAGERGGLLATITPEGAISAEIAERPAVPGKDVYLTIDLDVQKSAEAALGERVGSVVSLDPRDNSVLALASFPRYDPNLFITGLTAEQYNALANDPRQPFLHRPLLATYPPGSTFKVVTAMAGLERAGFSSGSTFHCTPTWNKLGDAFAQKNWQNVDRGYLTVSEGLMASCNPVFFDIAMTLDQTDPNIFPDFAKACGFGQLTGINALDEAPGVIPGPEWKEENIGEAWYTGDAVNMGIGQGYVLATPLQIANVYSAIADGASLRKPLLVKKIAEPGGAAAQEFVAEEINPLPASAGTIDAIRYGLTLVTQSAGGTSYHVFAGAGIDAAGKSGTAEDAPYGADHVFFVAYANRSAPSIVTLVALETGESGSREAGPMVRRILESYLAGAGGG